MLRSSGFFTVRKLTKNLPPKHMLPHISVNQPSKRSYKVSRRHIFLRILKCASKSIMVDIWPGCTYENAPEKNQIFTFTLTLPQNKQGFSRIWAPWTPNVRVFWRAFSFGCISSSLILLGFGGLTRILSMIIYWLDHLMIRYLLQLFPSGGVFGVDL